MSQMALLDQVDPLRFKLKLEKKAYCFTHSCKHCPTLMKTPWKVSSFIKKGHHGRSYHTVHAMRHLKNNFSEEVNDSVKDSLKAVELK